MPSASNNNQSNTKLVKQTSVNSVNSGGASSTSQNQQQHGSGGGVKGTKKITENSTKSNNSNASNAASAAVAATAATTNNNETSSIKTAKENTNNAMTANQNSKNWETSSSAGGNAINKDAGNDALNPMKLTFTTIEHKIRNLEKRKTKLEGYRAIQATGKELSNDQKAAVAKYDAVISTLEFARDLVKQMQQFTKDAEKEQKKQARKELIAKAQAETIKIREVLIIQNILSCFTDDVVRTDFLSGENGAAKMETNELDILEKFCSDVQTRRPETSEDAPFATSAQKAAEIFSMTIDARPKQYGETTYENVKRIFHRIQESDYLDKIYLTDVPEPEIKALDDEIEQDIVENNDDEVVVNDMINQEQELNSLEEDMDKLNMDAASNITQSVHEAPVVENVTIMGQQQVIMQEHLDLQQQQQVALANMPPQAAQAIMAAPLAPPATAVPSFQPANQAPTHSGATTPVHVALYHPSMQQPTPQQMQQIPNSAAIIGGVPPNTAGQILPGLAAQQPGVQNVATAAAVQVNQQQHQMLTSPATQPGVAPGPLAMQQGPPPGHFNPTPVHAVEQNFFKHQPPLPQPQPPQVQQQQQYLQQMRPLAEVIGSGNFYFLQDSELDSPDLNNQGVQGVPQNTLVFEQQQQQPPQPPAQQNLTQNKTTQNLMQEQTPTPTPTHQQQQQQMQQQMNQQQQLPPTQQQQPASAQTPIQTQTFTNQSFPQMPTLAEMQLKVQAFQNFQQQQQQQQTHQQQQQQSKASNANNQQLFSPVPQQNMSTSQQQQQQQEQTQLMMTAANEALQQQQQQQQQTSNTLMMMNRLGIAGGGGGPTTPLIQPQQDILQQQQQQITPQNQNLVGSTQQQQQIPTNSSTSTDMSQTPKNVVCPFEDPVVAGLSYEQQMQNALQEVSNVKLSQINQLHKIDFNEWEEAVLKGTSVSNSSNNQQDFKTATASQQIVDSSSNAANSSSKWSAEVNANSPITVQQTQSRKNEWSALSSSGNNNTVTNSDTGNGGYGNDNRTESNHWHSQDSSGYGRGSSGGNRGQGGGSNTGGYQRQRNDDRRDDRRPGGGTGGGYRGRSNYGSGNPQQNGQSRGGGGGGSSGIYFRNNENTSNNAYYQNGGGGGGGGSNVYNKESRYDSRGGSGGGNYRGPRGADSNSANPRSNGPPPRHMGNRSSGGNTNANTNSNSYMNSRQSSNRMPLGIENKN